MRRAARPRPARGGEHEVVIDRAKGGLRPRLADRRAKAGNENGGPFGGDDVGPAFGRSDQFAVMRGQTLDLAPRENGDGRGTEMPDHRASDHPGRADEEDSWRSEEHT